jgi:hypothetical protein
MSSDLLPLATAFFLGVRHCFDADHLAAMAQIATTARSPRHGLRAGLLWGLGHGISVLILGVVLSALWSRIPHVDAHAERLVGVTLIALSLWRLRSTSRQVHEHPHRHADGVVHTHAHTHAHDREHAHLHVPTVTGLIHGAAGALGVAVLLSMAAPGALVAAATVFSVGALLGMGAVGWLAARLYANAGAAGWGTMTVRVTATSGIVLGLFWLLAA